MTDPRRRRERNRSLGAIIGLSIGLLLMWALGLGGVLYGFVFGAGGAVVGGITAERFVGDSPAA